MRAQQFGRKSGFMHADFQQQFLQGYGLVWCMRQPLQQQVPACISIGNHGVKLNQATGMNYDVRQQER
jgi:hypothetical protein